MSLPPDPTNAALLYYQAFLLCPEPNEAEKELVYGGGIDQTYEYLRGAPIAFDPNIEPRLRELEGKFGPEPKRPDMTNPRGYGEYMEYLELHLLRDEHQRQDKMRGVDPNGTIRDYLRRCHDAIELAQAASELAECDWGLRHSQGIALRLPQLTELRSFAFILRCDALIHADNGDYRAALERCLMMCRFAHQIGDDARLLHVLSVAMDEMALRCIRPILGYAEPDANTLTWLRQRFAEERRPLYPPDRRLRMDFQHVLQSLRNNKGMLNKAREALRLKGQIRTMLRQESSQQVGGLEIDEHAENLTEDELDELKKIMALFEEGPERLPTDAQGVSETNDLTDEEIIALAAEPYGVFLEASLAVMRSDLPYEDKMAELRTLEREIEEEYGDNRDAQRMMLTHPEGILGLSIVIACSTELAHVYELHVRHMAGVNAVKAGIEIHLANARDGHLPERLPEGLPKDPFTGQDFEYEITQDGFALSLPDHDHAEDGYSTYNFKVGGSVKR